MSETKFTKGPWRFGEVDPCEDGFQEISVLADNPRDGSPYCVAAAIPCGTGKRDLAPEITEANAYLIAAAPDIYEALSTVVDFIDDAVDEDWYPTWVASARAALAKARGETP